MANAAHRVLILGGYGFFGRLIAARLARAPGIDLLIAGRDLGKATALAYQLGLRAENARAIDATLSRRPVPWLGSTTIGRWLSFCTTGIAEISSVLRV